MGSTKASACLIPEDLAGSSSHAVLIVVADVDLALLKATALMYPKERRLKDVDKSAKVNLKAQLGQNVGIGRNVLIGEACRIGSDTEIRHNTVIGRNVRIGKECRIYPNVTIYDDTEIGDRVIIHSGTVIGSDGFGFVRKKGRQEKIRQLGNVRIGNDVEIGANCAIDRATFGSTLIKRGTKLDNLIQVAHNVEIGEDCVIAAQTGIAGSTRIGNRVVIAGQVGIVGHVIIGDDVTIGAQAGVIGNIPAGEAFSGYPARPHQEALQREARLNRLEKLEIEIARILEKLEIPTPSKVPPAVGKKSKIAPKPRKYKKKLDK